MLKNRAEQVQTVSRLIDLVICIAAFYVAFLIRPVFPNSRFLHDIDEITWMLAASLIIHLFLYPMLGFYQSIRMKKIPELIAMIFRSFFIEFCILGSLIFVFQAKDTSRLFFGLFLMTNYSILLFERLGARVFLSIARRRGYNYRQVLIVGIGDNAKRVISILQKNKGWGYVPFALLRDPGSENSTLKEVLGLPILGNLENLHEMIQKRAVDEVYFAPENLNARLYEKEVSLCEALGIPARFSLSLFALPHSKVTFHSLGELPVITFYTTLMTPIETVIKRAIDIFVSIIGLLITVLLGPWIAFRIKQQSPGPIIFKQIRVGENGRLFKCYKFRTMYLDAEDRKADLQSRNSMEGPIFKIENDPRIFRFGHFLRRSSLDELPQFFNILRGDMSVVGTRPPTPDEVERYKVHYRRRLSIRPGLTGLWQVSGRNQINKFEEILALDLKYIDEWSIWLDFRIIMKTILVTLFGRGAY